MYIFNIQIKLDFKKYARKSSKIPLHLFNQCVFRDDNILLTKQMYVFIKLTKYYQHFIDTLLIICND